jgi:23S rRNA G2069 N7-methylase RlmK/C1962 C5-methylase RlmI
LAPNKKALARATGRYKRLNSAALKLVAPGGLLLTFSCSGAMTQSGEFVPMVQSAAIAVNRPVTLLRTLTAAADHVVNPAYPEGAYLTGAMLYCP